jgi:hypothetical protein
MWDHTPWTRRCAADPGLGENALSADATSEAAGLIQQNEDAPDSGRSSEKYRPIPGPRSGMPTMRSGFTAMTLRGSARHDPLHAADDRDAHPSTAGACLAKRDSGRQCGADTAVPAAYAVECTGATMGHRPSSALVREGVCPPQQTIQPLTTGSVRTRDVYSPLFNSFPPATPFGHGRREAPSFPSRLTSGSPRGRSARIPVGCRARKGSSPPGPKPLQLPLPSPASAFFWGQAPDTGSLP